MADEYRMLPSGRTVQRLADSAFIPVDPANLDYQAYLAWVEQGNAEVISMDLSNTDNTFGGDPWMSIGGPI